MTKKAFSLIELMVVIVIIGILSAIAVPSYKTYIIKSKITSGLPVLSQIINTAIQNYNENDSFPNTLSIYNLSIASGNGSYAAITNPLISGIHYNFSGNTMWGCIFYKDIGIPGWVANTGNNGTYTRLCIIAKVQNDNYAKYCGVWNATDAADIPVKYLPSGCNCDWLGNILSGNTSCYH